MPLRGDHAIGGQFQIALVVCRQAAAHLPGRRYAATVVSLQVGPERQGVPDTEERPRQSFRGPANSQRIATDKNEWAMRELSDLKRLDLKYSDSRIFPRHYAPGIVMENGRRVVKPMRYQCRPAGAPAFYDIKYPGMYNAMRALLTVRRHTKHDCAAQIVADPRSQHT